MSQIPIPTKLHDLVKGERVLIDGVEQTITTEPRKIVDGAVEFSTDLNPKGFYFHPSSVPYVQAFL